MRDPNCMCGEPTVDPWCIVCCPSDPFELEPCYYCGEKIDGLAGDPGKWPVSLPHNTDPGVMKNHHIGCVTERLEASDKVRRYMHMPINFKQIACDHMYIPFDPDGQSEGECSGIVCYKCNYRPHGWYCPDSADHQCAYELIDSDSCDFCGQPDERK